MVNNLILATQKHVGVIKMPDINTLAQQVISFWFKEIDPSKWWVKDEEFDQEIKDKFLLAHQQATKGELFHWRVTPQGRLAEIIILDQFSRNMFRDTPASFSTDSLALILAQEAISNGDDALLSPTEKSFLYMPFMHSESLIIHDEAIKLFTALGNENNLAFEKQHRDIIEKFGRYPHRNNILNRSSTPEEIAFLQQPNSSF